MEIVIHNSDILVRLCKESKKYGMYVGGMSLYEAGESTSDEGYAYRKQQILLAAPWVKELDNWFQGDLLCAGEGYLLFDTQEEMLKIFKQSIGDDGPNEVNSYAGPCKIYALTCDPTGKLLSENT